MANRSPFPLEGGYMPCFHRGSHRRELNPPPTPVVAKKVTRGLHCGSSHVATFSLLNTISTKRTRKLFLRNYFPIWLTRKYSHHIFPSRYIAPNTSNKTPCPNSPSRFTLSFLPVRAPLSLETFGVTLRKLVNVPLHDAFQIIPEPLRCDREIPSHIPQFLRKMLSVQRVPLEHRLFHDVDTLPRLSAEPHDSIEQ